MENPFSTKFWSAGNIPFQFAAPEETIDVLLDCMQQYSACQIIGPHGSGKSTLLHNLKQQYEKSGEKGQYLFFNDQSYCIPKDFRIENCPIIFADGFEQLRLWDRLRLRFRSKRLVITAHHPRPFMPILYQTRPEFSIFFKLVRQLISNPLQEHILWDVYTRSGGNFRTAFFELYDYTEQQYGLFYENENLPHEQC